MSTKKIIIILSSIAIVLILIAVFSKKDNKGIKVAAEKIEARNITEEVTASGTIYPESEVKISPDVSGEIIDLYVKEGDTVKQGQLLVRINPDIYQTQLEQAKAGLNNAIIQPVHDILLTNSTTGGSWSKMSKQIRDFITTNKGRNAYFMLPFLLGIIGLAYHYKKKKNDFTVLALLFFFTGMAILLYLNQTPICLLVCFP